MRAGTPSDPALWSLVLLTCVAVPASSSGRQFGGHEHHEDRGGRRIDHERFGAHRNGISQKLLVDNINTVDSWLANASFAADPNELHLVLIPRVGKPLFYRGGDLRPESGIPLDL